MRTSLSWSRGWAPRMRANASLQKAAPVRSCFGFPFTLRPVRYVLGKITVKAGVLFSQFGHGGDRKSLTLHSEDEALIASVAAANPRTAVVLIGGSAILMEEWRDKVPAILLGWYPGMEGGRALADVLIGVAEPAGRLPVAIPVRAEHLPFFDADAPSIVYDAWWGQRKLDRDGNPAAFPFGFGLGYTTFDIALLDHRAGDADGLATVRVTNTGSRAGSTVVQMYTLDGDAPRPVPQLIGFGRVELAAGQTAAVDVRLDLTPTREREPHTGTWSRRAGTWRILAAPHSPSIFKDAAPLFGFEDRADRQKGNQLGIVTTSSETAFMYPPEVVYDFVTNPANWTKTYPTSTQIGGLPDELPLKVGDTWYEGGPEGGDKLTTWHLAIAMRPTLFVFNSVGRLRSRPQRRRRHARAGSPFSTTSHAPGRTSRSSRAP